MASSTCTTIAGSAYSFGVGSHSYSAAATDRAGNTCTGNTTFTVRVTAGGLCALTQQFFTSQQVASSLCDMLSLGHVQAYTALVNDYSASTYRLIAPSNAAILIRLASTL